LISKKSFGSEQLINSWIHENVVINEKNIRLYNTGLYGCEQIFYNEVGHFFLSMLGKNLKMYYIKSSPKHNIVYNQDCFNFFKLFRETRDNNLIMPENLKKLREMQCEDLMNFYDNLILESFWIISKIENNLYFYDIIIITKDSYNINDFFKIDFNVIHVESITPIYNYNINYCTMQQWFNFEELSSYNFCYILTQDYYNIIYNPEHEELLEYKIFKKFEDDEYEKGNIHMQHNNQLYWQYFNDYAGAVSEMLDQKLMFGCCFSMFGFQWFILNYNFKDMFAVEAENHTYPINEPFLLTGDNMAKPAAIIKPDGKTEIYSQKYESGCMFDLLGILNGCDNYSIYSYVISVPKIKYNTSYKCRLNKK